ncbi:MAG: hypothetical protein WD734_06045 [Dehalococcoidia bacterium]
MWETPTRGRGTPGGGGDALGGPPDSMRPSNPWPRLLALLATVLLAAGLAAVCVASFAVPPKRELVVELTALEPGLPRFLPVTTMGADEGGSTYGAWVVTHDDGEMDAFLSRDAGSRCHVRWDGTAVVEGRVGFFVDRCSGAQYAVGGALAAGETPRDLDAFPVRREGTRIIVDVTEVTLGTCRGAAALPCSTADEPDVRRMPNTGLPSEAPR